MPRPRKYKRLIKRLDEIKLIPYPAPKDKVVYRAGLELDRNEVDFLKKVLAKALAKTLEDQHS
jgi:hypothetical protein